MKSTRFSSIVTFTWNCQLGYVNNTEIGFKLAIADLFCLSAFKITLLY